MFDLESHIDYWKNSAERNWATALDLFKLKHYDACLFFCHLTIEKLLKGLVVQKIRKPAPYLHDLARLAHLAGLALSVNQTQELRTITTFNIAGRYDEVKFAFYKKCTPEFTKKYLAISEELYIWLKKQYQKK